MTAYVRNKTSRVVTGHVYFGKNEIKNDVHDLNDIIRVCVDSVCFKKKMPDLEKVPDLKYENKSSGLIKWINACKYINKTTGQIHGKFNDEDRYDIDDIDDE